MAKSVTGTSLRDFVVIASDIPYRVDAHSGNIDFFVKELESRGFDMVCYLLNGNRVTFALKLSELLQAKLSVQANGDMFVYSEAKSDNSFTKELHYALLILGRIPFMKPMSLNGETYSPSSWLAHSDTLIDHIMSSTKESLFKVLPIITMGDFPSYRDDPLQHICQYFDPTIATYFGFLDYYNRLLFLPAVCGLTVVAYQTYGQYAKAYASSVNDLALWFCLFMGVWGTVYIEYWKRRFNTLAYYWKDSFQDDDILNTDQTLRSSKTLRVAMTTTICIFLILCVLYIAIHSFSAQLEARRVHSPLSVYYYLPTIVYSVYPVLFTLIFSKLARWMTDFERHLTMNAYRRYYIWKIFCVQFVNRYSALLYAAFWIQDISLVQALLSSLLITNAVINNIVEVGYPLLCSVYTSQRQTSTECIINKRLTQPQSISALQDTATHLTALPKDSDVSTPKDSYVKSRTMSDASSSQTKLTSRFFKLPSKPAKFMNSIAHVFSTSKQHTTSEDPNNLTQSSTSSSVSSPVKKLPNINLFSKKHSPRSNKKEFFKPQQPKPVFTDDMKEYWQEKLKKEISLPENDLDEDYQELVLQYGYVTLFVVIFPIGPFLALFNNFFEGLVDLTKLKECRRVKSLQNPSLGAWHGCLQAITVLAVITNCFLLNLLPSHLDELAAYAHAHINEMHVYPVALVKLAIVVFIEHILFLVMALLSGVIEDSTEEVVSRRYEDSKKNQEKLLKMSLRLHALEKLVGSNSDDILNEAIHEGEEVSREKGMKKFLPSIMTHSSNKGKSVHPPRKLSTESGQVLLSRETSDESRISDGEDMQRRVSISTTKLMEDTFHHAYPTKQLLLQHLYPDKYAFLSSHPSEILASYPGHRMKISRSCGVAKSNELFKTSSFGFNPTTIMAITFLPLTLQYFSLPIWYYIPSALFAFTYLQGRKDLDDRRIALQISSDIEMSHILGYLTATNHRNYLPAFIQDTSYERIEWCNFIMEKLWPWLSHYGELKAMETFISTVEKHKPPFVKYVKLERIFFGDVPPKMLGVRILESSEDVVRMDWEFRYSGNPDIVIKVGTLPLPTTLAVTELRMAFKIRVELLNFDYRMPPFNLISVSFLELPSIDFSFSVGGVDVMSVGPKDIGVARLVKSMINAAISQEALYPRKVYLHVRETDSHIDTSIPPQGVLTIVMERANKLPVGDLISSDPYIVLQCLEQTAKTTVKHSTVNPEYNETFDFVIYDKALQTLELTVYDNDIATTDQILGKATLDLRSLLPLRNIHIEKQLDQAKSGSLIFSATYIPLYNKYANTLPSSANSTANAVEAIDHGEGDVLYHVSLEDLIGGDVLPNIEPNHMHGHIAMSQKVGVLTVSAIRCRNIRTGPSQGSRPVSSAYVTVEVGEDVRATRVQKRSLGDPAFFESFSFVVRNPQSKELVVKVKEKSLFLQDKVIGDVTLSLEHVIHGASHEQEYLLNGEVDCYVHFKLRWVGSRT